MNFCLLMDVVLFLFPMRLLDRGLVREGDRWRDCHRLLREGDRWQDCHRLLREGDRWRDCHRLVREGAGGGIATD